MSPRNVSVVVASGAGGEFLFRCLASLSSQTTRPVEILVVDRMGAPTRERLGREFPEVRVIAAADDHRATVPELRRLGAEAARGQIVAILEEHCTAPPHWLSVVQEQFGSGAVAVGGPILDGAFDRIRDWVVYFSEYHNFLPPWPDGERYLLNGANIAYDRAALLRYRDLLESGYWEVVLHPKLIHDGAFRAVNGMGAYHTGPFNYGYYLRQRYLLSRSWGGAQKDRVPAAIRLAHILLGPVLPLFLFARVTRRVLVNGKLVGKYLAALPLLVPTWIAYAWGETLGYLLGPGNALEEVE